MSDPITVLEIDASKPVILSHGMMHEAGERSETASLPCRVSLGNDISLTIIVIRKIGYMF